MRHPAEWGAAVLAAGVLVLAFSREAWAYIDFGTGSYLFQLAIAGMVGASFAVKLFWSNVKKFFAKLFSRRHTTKGEDDPR